MNTVISDFEILTPFGLGAENHTQKILVGESAITKVSEDFGGKNFSVPFYGAINFEDFGFKEELNISKHHMAAKILIDRIASRLKNKKIDAVFILGKHFLISDLTSAPLRPPKHLNKDYFLAQYVESYLRDSYGIIVPDKNFYEINNTCTSGTSLISLASQGIRHSKWQQVLIIAIDLADPFTLCSLETLGALSREGKPEEASKPFDRRRGGFVKSDGAAIALLKSESLSLDMHESTPLRVLGFCQTSDGYHLTEGEPDGKYVQLAMETALYRSGLNLNQLAFIKAHGTGTVYNDLHEALAIQAMQGKQIPICAYKGHLGHTTDASGLIEVLLAGYSLHKRIILPIKNLTEPEFELNFVTTPIFNSEGNYILCNNFGFGGYNSSLVVEKISRPF